MVYLVKSYENNIAIIPKCLLVGLNSWYMGDSEVDPVLSSFDELCSFTMLLVSKKHCISCEQFLSPRIVGSSNIEHNGVEAIWNWYQL